MYCFLFLNLCLMWDFFLIVNDTLLFFWIPQTNEVSQVLSFVIIVLSTKVRLFSTAVLCYVCNKSESFLLVPSVSKNFLFTNSGTLACFKYDSKTSFLLFTTNPQTYCKRNYILVTPYFQTRGKKETKKYNGQKLYFPSFFNMDIRGSEILLTKVKQDRGRPETINTNVSKFVNICITYRTTRLKNLEICV